MHLATETTIANEAVLLDAQRAMYWPRMRTLFLADVHLGKVSHFRQAGVSLSDAVQAGATGAAFARMDDLIARHQPIHLVFLGDLLHSAAIHRSNATLDALTAWRAKHAALRMTLIRGNHDDKSGDPPASLNIECVDEPLAMEPFAACHYPETVVDGLHTLAGHIHPAVRLSGGYGNRREGVRLACFWVSDHATVLPAFGEFTGTHVVKPRVGDRVFVVADERVVEVG
jgi:uncharacterized protein